MNSPSQPNKSEIEHPNSEIKPIFALMKSKFRNPVILFFASFLLIGLGMASKVMRWPGSNITFGGGMIVQMFSILWLIVVIIRPEKKEKV